MNPIIKLSESTYKISKVIDGVISDNLNTNNRLDQSFNFMVEAIIMTELREAYSLNWISKFDLLQSIEGDNDVL
jgi:hypothetical protein